MEYSREEAHPNQRASTYTFLPCASVAVPCCNKSFDERKQLKDEDIYFHLVFKGFIRIVSLLRNRIENYKDKETDREIQNDKGERERMRQRKTYRETERIYFVVLLLVLLV